MSRRLAATLLVLLICAGIAAATVTARGATASFTVTSTANSGAGTLRQAILDANANNNAARDVINFNFPGDGPHTIAVVGSALPTITEPVRIEGYTQGKATVTATDDAVENSNATGPLNTVLKVVVDGTGAAVSAHGITVDAPDVAIRGLNVVNFGGSGIFLNNDADDGRVEGNFVGTNAAGAAAAPNSGGVEVLDASNVLVGGDEAKERNLLSGNDGTGVGTSASGVTGLDLQGNVIGANAAASAPLPNGSAGVNIRGTDQGDITIGGKQPALGNLITGNGNDGIQIFVGGSDTEVIGNSIHDNATLGIDLENNGVSANDPGDGDVGSNGLQNFPVITSASVPVDDLALEGKLKTKPRRKYSIQVYASADPDPSGNGEGERFLGRFNVTTNSKGKASFSKSLVLPGGVTDVAATATEKKKGNTSEFSVSEPILF